MSSDSADSEADSHPVRAVFENPPPWLVSQLAKYREDPDRLKNPTCSSISTHVFGTAARWQEVMPFLEGEL